MPTSIEKTSGRGTMPGYAEPDVLWGTDETDLDWWADGEPWAEPLSPAQPKTTDLSDDELLWLGRS